MQVIVDARMILPQQTGVGRYLQGLASALSELPGEDRFEFWLQSSLPAEHPIFQLQNRQLNLRKLAIDHMDLRQQWVVPAQLRRERPDVLHYPHFDLPFAVPGPVVATIHDLKYILRPNFFPQQAGSKRLLMILLMRYTAWRAERVIAVSESTRADLIRHLKVPAEKIKVVPEGVEAGFFRNPAPGEAEHLRQRYHLESPFILFVGERRLHKNISGAVRAFDLFRKMATRSYRLVIVGKPYADYQEPEQLVEALGLGDWVHFLNYVSEADLPALYRAAEALILISWYEGFGLPVLEAMAAGTPVVAAATTALPEVVGDAGLLVPPDEPEQAAEALRQVVAGGSMRQTCIERGYERVSNFTWGRCARETLAIYRSAAAHGAEK